MKNYLFIDMKNLVNILYHANLKNDNTITENEIKINLLNYLEIIKDKLKIQDKNYYCVFDAPNSYDKNKDKKDLRSWRYEYLENLHNNNVFTYKDGRNRIEEIEYYTKFLFDNVEKIGYQKLYKDNYEADDLIALFINKFYNKNDIFNILSSDTDYYQLIKNNIKLYSNIFKEPVNKTPIEAKISSFVKIMIGDKADNIPNITHNILPKIQFGEKTAKKIIENNFLSILNNKNIDNKLKFDVLIQCSLDDIMEIYLKKEKDTFKLELIRKELLDKIMLNHKIVSFSKIPENLKKNFDIYISNKKINIVSNKNKINIYQKYKCKDLVKKYNYYDNNININ